jgi:hypothetical protein
VAQDNIAGLGVGALASPCTIAVTLPIAIAVAAVATMRLVGAITAAAGYKFKQQLSVVTSLPYS